MKVIIIPESSPKDESQSPAMRTVTQDKKPQPSAIATTTQDQNKGQNPDSTNSSAFSSYAKTRITDCTRWMISVILLGNSSFFSSRKKDSA